ncbi:hypothetical protein NXC14_PA00041 (plasmid) [Rhizobium sp. NXC14]|uniref:DUF4019 domain-containing protein n=1 Tax=Rhizobium sp. NXC14 TaxID=1981173 RepID=UPI000A203608|nr:DUF4019 domain-containing protein [Rhizobium sp. NXC14]ARO32338.1 hypothetical protein NXC14_PA00041 [Rhizobium sp. NXC14]
MNSRTSARRKLLVGQININNLLGFAFGVTFVAVMLVFATQYPNPTPSQLFTFVVVLGLAAAGVGAILPGVLGIEWKGPGGVPAIRAGGALALFVLVFLFRPTIEGATVKFVPPAASPEPIALSYLAASDSGNITQAWSELDDAAKGIVIGSRDDMERMYKDFVTRLGQVQSRKLMGTGGAESPPGYPLGLYRVLNYRTKFANDGGKCRLEAVTVRATQDLIWKVFSHLISPTTIDC